MGHSVSMCPPTRFALPSEQERLEIINSKVHSLLTIEASRLMFRERFQQELHELAFLSLSHQDRSDRLHSCRS
jgi:hypothetical protein